RTSTNETAAMIRAIRAEFDALDKGFPVFNIRSMEARIDDALSRDRIVASISATFGVLALLLASVGLYGILAYSVTRRTREIGIRMALGSARQAVLWLIVREALGVVAIGSTAGILMALAASRVVAQYLAGVYAVGPLVLIGATAGMLFVGVAAV